MAKGYAPSKEGNPSRRITPVIINVNMKQFAVRALNRMIRSHNTNKITLSDVEIGEKVAFYYNSTKGT